VGLTKVPGVLAVLLVLVLPASASADRQGPTQACIPCIDAHLEGRYRQSDYVGRLVVETDFPSARELHLQIEGGTDRVSRMRFRFSVPAGEARRELRVSRRFTPGEYGVTNLSPTLFTVARLKINSPPEGVVLRARARLSEFGPIVTRVRRPARQLWAEFEFVGGAFPRPGRRLTVTWFAPGGRAIPALRKRRDEFVVTFVRSPTPLARGRWRCLLRAGGVPVEQLTVRVG
jgi:hypothetical protein